MLVVIILLKFPSKCIATLVLFWDILWNGGQNNAVFTTCKLCKWHALAHSLPCHHRFHIVTQNPCPLGP